MAKHKKLYLNHFNFKEGDFIACEVCGASAVDIHHIERRGMGGSNSKDYIENLIALCRSCHNFYGDKTKYKEMLKSLQKTKLDGITNNQVWKLHL